MSLPTVSVVIPTYNRRATLPTVLEPILASPETLEVVVVVDGCHDGSYELLRDRSAEDARVVPVLVPNGGAAVARQVGVEQARGEVVLFLDDDVVATPGLPAGHARHHAGAASLVVVGYMPTALPEVRTPGRFATYLYAEEYERHVRSWEVDPTLVLPTLWQGNVSIRRTDALAVGMRVPEMLSGYHVDQEFGLRCLSAGLIGVFDRGLEASHGHARPLVAFRRDARDQGASMFAVHHLHPEVKGPFDPHHYQHGLPRPLRAVVRAGRVGAVGSVLAGAVELAGRAHAYRAETDAARLLRRVENQRGARLEAVRRSKD